MQKITLEACVETLEEAIKAEQLGAHRIELCSRLDLDGLTPGNELVLSVLEKLSIPVKVMVRPRGGNFEYSEPELEKMIETINWLKTTKAEGVVFGIMEQGNQLNRTQTRRLPGLSAPLEVTIHKAINYSHDPLEEVERLRSINGVKRILTSGKRRTALEGAGLKRTIKNKKSFWTDAQKLF